MLALLLLMPLLLRLRACLRECEDEQFLRNACWYYVHLRVFSQLPGGSDEGRLKVVNKNTKENKLCMFPFSFVLAAVCKVSIFFRVLLALFVY